MRRIIYLILILLLHHLSVYSQKPDTVRLSIDNTSRFLWDRGSSFTPQNTLYQDIDLSSYELLSANLSFSDKDQTQKVVLAPFKLTNNAVKWKHLTQARLNLSLKDKITTIGIGFGGDNFSPYTKRANRIRDALFDTIPAPGVPTNNFDATVEQQIINILSACQINDTSRHKLLDSLGIGSCLDEESIQELQRLYNEKRLQLIFQEYEKTQLAASNKILDSLLLLYDQRVARHTLKWSFGYNRQLFSNLFAQGDAGGFDSLNYFNTKANTISASGTYGFDNNCLVLTATYNQLYARTTAVKDQKTVPYYGPSFSASVRLFKLVDQTILDTSASYRKNLFVPSLNFGISYEGRYADRAFKYEPFYQDNIKRTVAWTPYLDVLITPALQFRLAIPIVRNTLVTNDKQIAAGANIQYNLKLSNLVQ